MIDGLKKIFGDKGGSLLGKFFFISYEVVELTITTKLDECIEILIILKKTIDFYNIGMFKIGLNFKLANELV
jgi:hypothetical protein